MWFDKFISLLHYFFKNYVHEKTSIILKLKYFNYYNLSNSGQFKMYYNTVASHSDYYINTGN